MRYEASDLEKINPHIIDFWTRWGFHVVQLSPYEIRGESYYDEMGIKPRFTLTSHTDGENTYFNLTFDAKITSGGITGIILLGIFFWPVALALGFYSHSK